MNLKHFSFDASTSIVTVDYETSREYYAEVLKMIETLGYKVKMININEF